MPVVLRKNGYRFQFYATDRDEPPHIHAAKDRKQAKFWLTRAVTLEKNQGFRRHELNEVERLIEENRNALLEFWNDFFNQ